MSISRSQYIKLERGERRLTEDYINRAATAFQVTTNEILEDPVDVPVMGYVGAGAMIEPDFEQIPEDGLYQITLPFAVPDEMLAFVIKGDSMLPRYDDGDVIVVWREQRRNFESFYGEEAAIRTSDGRRYLKQIVCSNGGVMLMSWNAKPIENVNLEWIGEIYATIRASQLRRAVKKI